MEYYESNGVRAIDVIEAFELDFNLGNVLKYIVRAGKKTEEPFFDLDKALYYLKRSHQAALRDYRQSLLNGQQS